MRQKPQGIADLQRQIENRERSIEILTAAAERLEELVPELTTYADETLPERVEALMKAIAALVQPDDPTLRMNPELPGQMLVSTPLAHVTHGRALGSALKGVEEAAADLRRCVQTLAQCSKLAGPDIAAEGERFRREFIPSARAKLEITIEAKRKAARAVAVELEAVQAEREAMAAERGEAAE